MHIHHVATDEMGIPQINVLDQEVGMVTPMCLHLTSKDLLDKLQVPDESLSLLMGMGYKENAAKRALRMTGQDVQPAVHFLVEELGKYSGNRRIFSDKERFCIALYFARECFYLIF
ncbi:uncharacterized protein LOC103989869 [Musa acuminata AAA Group]|uniref:uncharacterized protein LOC103989869 n=1 Tax=Musa acuminata AAA Group TaxID=214697 RepID=UPI0031DA55F4